jgi:serine/threonine protein phosphatase 1
MKKPSQCRIVSLLWCLGRFSWGRYSSVWYIVMARTLFIWDIHGCYNELVELYKKMEITEKDIVYATGDLIHWWPYSQRTVQFLREKNIKSVLGNHDVAFLQWYGDPARQREWHNEVAQEFIGHESDIVYLQSLPYWIETENFLLIHAGLVPGISLWEQDLNSLVKIREYEWKPWYYFYEWEKLIIYGHWSQQELRFTKNTRWLDSSCVWWGHLTGYCLETNELWQVRANRVYKVPDKWLSDKN